MYFYKLMWISSDKKSLTQLQAIDGNNVDTKGLSQS